MDVDLALILVILAAVTGAIWGLDRLFFYNARLARARALAGSGGGEEAVREPLAVEYARSFFPVILVVLVFRSFLAEPFKIPSGSMMPTLLVGDFVLVNKFAYGLRLPVLNTKIVEISEPKRGDVFVFVYPGFSCERDGKPVRSGKRCDHGEALVPVPKMNYIKRVVGLPGDHIVYRDKTLYVNGQEMPNSYVGPFVGSGMEGQRMAGADVRLERLGDVEHQILAFPLDSRIEGGREGEWTVPPGHYFAMGDNRDNSEDSRYWGFVPEQNLVGRAFLIWMNWDGGIDFKRLGTLIK